MIGRLVAASLACACIAPAAFAAGHGSPAKHRTAKRGASAESVAASVHSSHPDLDALIAAHARANGVPEELVHRIIRRESRYNPHAVGRGGALGLMQIKQPTARALGYTGSSAGLLDADTNLTYGVRYLAGAYRVANGDAGRAVSYFSSGYYYVAKRKGLLPSMMSAPDDAPEEATAQAAVVPEVKETASTSSWSSLLSPAEHVGPDLSR